jgi:hypothetical protein
MVCVDVMQVSVDQVVHVSVVRNYLMPAAETMSMSAIVNSAVVSEIAPERHARSGVFFILKIRRNLAVLLAAAS